VFPLVAFQDRGISDTFAALICHGVLERFPNLRLASIENGAMWVPDLLRNLKDAHGKMPFAFKEHPVEQFRRQVWVAPYYEDDMARLKDELGIERLLFGSDFPHTEGLPEPTHFVKDIPTFDDAEVRAIMRDNVLELMTVRPRSGASRPS
jgi:predicted TIM-barrel fold metal-dependent hydrolase